MVKCRNILRSASDKHDTQRSFNDSWLKRLRTRRSSRNDKSIYIYHELPKPKKTKVMSYNLFFLGFVMENQVFDKLPLSLFLRHFHFSYPAWFIQVLWFSFAVCLDRFGRTVLIFVYCSGCLLLQSVLVHRFLSFCTCSHPLNGLL